MLHDAILPAVLLILIHAIRLNAFRTTLILQRTMSELDNRSQSNLQIASKLKMGIKHTKARGKQAAHDFGTPLTVLLPAVESLVDDHPDHPMAAGALAAAKSLVRLRDVMMDDTSIALGEKLQPRRDTEAPHEFLGDINTIAGGLADAAEIEFNLIVVLPGGGELRVGTNGSGIPPTAFLPIVADAARMTNITLNFASNAIKHARSHVEMVIPVPTTERGWRVEIHDNGTGVPAALAPVLFGSDMGTEMSAQTHDGGNGVGLWSVKKTCECLEGDCGFAQSPRLGGAMFWFWVPYVPDLLAADIMARADGEIDGGESKTAGESTTAGESKTAGDSMTAAPEARRRQPWLETAATAESAASAELAATPTMDVLVIDDSSMIRRMLIALLGRHGGHNVTVAKNGRSGLTMMQERQFSLVISDVQMPYIDGFEMTERLRAWEGEHRPAWRQPLVLMSANVGEEGQSRVSLCCGWVGVVGGGRAVCFVSSSQTCNSARVQRTCCLTAFHSIGFPTAVP